MGTIKTKIILNYYGSKPDWQWASKQFLPKVPKTTGAARTTECSEVWCILMVFVRIKKIFSKNLNSSINGNTGNYNDMKFNFTHSSTLYGNVCICAKIIWYYVEHSRLKRKAVRSFQRTFHMPSSLIHMYADIIHFGLLDRKLFIYSWDKSGCLQLHCEMRSRCHTFAAEAAAFSDVSFFSLAHFELIWHALNLL